MHAWSSDANRRTRRGRQLQPRKAVALRQALIPRDRRLHVHAAVWPPDLQRLATHRTQGKVGFEVSTQGRQQTASSSFQGETSSVVY